MEAVGTVVDPASRTGGGTGELLVAPGSDGVLLVASGADGVLLEA